MYLQHLIKVLGFDRYNSRLVVNARLIVRFVIQLLLILGLSFSIGGCVRYRHSVDISSLTAVIRSHPNDPEGYNVRGVIYAKYGNFDEALKDFQSALDLNPLYYKAYVNRALVFFAKGNFSMALKDYNSALKINPNYGIAYIGRGDIYRTKDYSNPKRSIEDFNYAIKIKTPDIDRAFYGRALAHQMLGLHDKAIDDFSLAMSMSPLLADHYNGRGISYLAIKNYDNAVEDFKIAISINPKIAKFWFNQGLAYEMQGDYENALASYKTSLSIGYRYNKSKDAVSRIKRLLYPN